MGENHLEVNPCKSLKPVKHGAGTYLPSASLKKQMPRLAWRQESAWPSSVSSLGVEEKTGVWGPCWEKKKAKNPPRGGERYWKLRELRLFYFYFEIFSFILKYKLRGSCKTVPSSPV